MKAHTLPKLPAKLATAVILSAVSLLLAGCFYMPGVGGRPAKAGLSINRSLLPANVSSFALIVGGPGMQPITAQYPVGTTSATLSVPSGVARTFTVLANTPSVTFRGDTTVDLAPDEAKDISVTPVLSSSQILIPDEMNSRVVQVSDMMGTGWKELSFSSAYDVDFDDQGHVYFSGSAGVVRVDDISGTNPVSVNITSGTFQSIAMDRTHGILYYSGVDVQGAGGLWRRQVTPTIGVTEDVVNLSGIVTGAVSLYGIAVDSDGFVYVENYYSTPELVKIDVTDPKSPVEVARYKGSLSIPWDVMVNGDFVYVSDKGALKILRLDRNLSLVDSFGGPQSDPFVGPEQFVAVLNKPITLIDENSSTDRLVTFNDMTGAGWTKYGSTGSGVGFFQFYSVGGSGSGIIVGSGSG